MQRLLGTRGTMLQCARVAVACALFVVSRTSAVLQAPLRYSLENQKELETSPKSSYKSLHGRFLHITDPFYKTYTSSEESIACHRGQGPAGFYGAETSDCDSPFALVNSTFKWIEENLKDSIDFIIWTGDSARHDNDEHHPRSDDQVVGLNTFLVSKFREVFGGDSKNGGNEFSIPIVPSFGNNDILPHNLFFKGPNKWTRTFAEVWRPFIPEEQRHGFDRGGWFFVEVIPNKLAVFSLNTLWVPYQSGLTNQRYFFDSNTAVDGCNSRSEPGYEHMEWLRIQLQFLRERGVKAIMSGHVPPARNDEKAGWDETCWQKYTLWLRQYRDVVIGSLYGHMNVEHFVLQDFKDISYNVAMGMSDEMPEPESPNNDLSAVVNAPDYLNALRLLWSKLPSVPDSVASTDKQAHASRKKHKHLTEEDKFFDKIGGPHAERFAVSHISASVVPNFYTTLRVFEYNTTGLEESFSNTVHSLSVPRWEERVDDNEAGVDDMTVSAVELEKASLVESLQQILSIRMKKKKHKKHKKNKKKRPKFIVPEPPAKTAPPGPAYSAQSLSWIGYIQYYANNTLSNNDFVDEGRDGAHVDGWNPGRYADRTPGKQKPKPKPGNFSFEVEYDTRKDKEGYRLDDGLTVRKWVELASRIGEYGHGLDLGECNGSAMDGNVTSEDASASTIGAEKKKKKHHKDRSKRRKIQNRDWFAFVSRAVTATMPSEELHERFGEECVEGP